MTPLRPELVAAAALLLLGTLSAASAETAPHILMDPVVQRVTHFLGEAQSSPAPPPSGPALPTIQDGIGPGSGLQQFASTDPNSPGFLCSGAFLLRDPVTATYYLSTAGHCLVRDEADPKPYTGAANPDKVDQEIDICVSGCIDNALAVGTYVKLVPGPGYAPVAYAESGGPGQDFGLIQIPADRHALLRPWIPQFGGPTGLGSTQSGDLLVHYGHGTYCCVSPVGGVASRTPADQGRVATSLGPDSLFGSPAGTSFSAVGSSTAGDSGSAVAVGVESATRGIQGTTALGVLTHGIAIEGIPYFEGTALAHGLDMVKAATGMRLQLVLQDDPLTAVADPSAARVPHVAITAPAPAATVRPGSDGTTPILGTAGLGNGTPPANALVQVAIDDAAFAAASRVPVAGNATWSAQWDLHGVPLGRHLIYARLVGPDGSTLAALNQSVTVAARTSATAPSTPGASPHGPSGLPGSGTGVAASGTGSAPPARKSPSPALAPLLALAAVAAALRRKH